MVNKKIDEIFAPFFHAWDDFWEKEGSFAFLTESEYRRMSADYHYYQNLCLLIKLRNSQQSQQEQELAPSFLYNAKEDGADVCMKKKHSRDMEMY